MANRLKNLKIGEVSFCVKGMNQHARVALFKSADPAQTGPIALAKKSFNEALKAQLVSERISEVFWKAFEKQWAVREAFRTALSDELATGGDGTEATEGFTKAMRTLAEGAAAQAREAGADVSDVDLESAVEQAVEKWLDQQETSDMNITTKAQLRAAVAKFNPETDPAAHVGIIKSAAATLNAEDELPDDGPLAKTKQDPALAKALTEIAVLKMAPEVRKHYEGLDEAGQTAFLAKSAADQAAEVAKANEGDPVVYTCADGTHIRKSDGATAAIMAKRLDEQAAEIVTLKAGRNEDSLEKRAAAYPNVAKATAISLLKTADKVGVDTPEGKDVIKSLETMQKGAAGLFKSLGSTVTPEVGRDVAKARTDFNAAVSKIMSRDKIGMADAMSKARDEEPDLFAEAYPETAAADEELEA